MMTVSFRFVLLVTQQISILLVIHYFESEKLTCMSSGYSRRVEKIWDRRVSHVYVESTPKIAHVEVRAGKRIYSRASNCEAVNLHALRLPVRYSYIHRFHSCFLPLNTCIPILKYGMPRIELFSSVQIFGECLQSESYR